MLYYTGDPQVDRKRWIAEVAYAIATDRPVPAAGKDFVCDACVYLARMGILVPLPERAMAAGSH